MDVEPQELASAWEGVKWIAGTVGTLLMALGAILGTAKLRELTRVRKWKKEDDLEALQITADTERTKADVTLTQSLLLRVESLEKGQAQLNADIIALTKMNAELKVRNEYQQKELDRKDRQIDDLIKEASDREKRIIELTNEVDRLRRELQRLSERVNKGDGLKPPQEV